MNGSNKEISQASRQKTQTDHKSGKSPNPQPFTIPIRITRRTLSSMIAKNPSDWLNLFRRVRFGETDSAGVVHFQHVLRWCHESYEESLEIYGASTNEIFPTPNSQPKIALPIIHCSADFWKPATCGITLDIELQPFRIDPTSFEVSYEFRSEEAVIAKGITRHAAIEANKRKRCNLPKAINRWLEASSIQRGVSPL